MDWNLGTKKIRLMEMEIKKFRNVRRRIEGFLSLGGLKMSFKKVSDER